MDARRWLLVQFLRTAADIAKSSPRDEREAHHTHHTVTRRPHGCLVVLAAGLGDGRVALAILHLYSVCGGRLMLNARLISCPFYRPTLLPASTALLSAGPKESHRLSPRNSSLK